MGEDALDRIARWLRDLASGKLREDQIRDRENFRKRALAIETATLEFLQKVVSGKETTSDRIQILTWISHLLDTPGLECHIGRGAAVDTVHITRKPESEEFTFEMQSYYNEHGI